MSDEPKALGDSLDSLLRSMHGASRQELGGVFGTWDEAVGPLIATHVRPAKLEDGVLTVAVDDPAWATQTRLLEGDIRAKILVACGVDLARIEVHVAPSGRRR